MANQNTKTYPTWKIFMLKQWSKSSNLIKNPQPITITNGGYGCNSLGYAWPWNPITLINWGSVSLLQHPTCLFLKKGSLPFRHWKSLYRPKRRSRRFFKRAISYLQRVQLEKPLSANPPKLWMIPLGWIKLSITKTAILNRVNSTKASSQAKESRNPKDSNSWALLPTLSFLSIIYQKNLKIWM